MYSPEVTCMLAIVRGWRVAIWQDEWVIYLNGESLTGETHVSAVSQRTCMPIPRAIPAPPIVCSLICLVGELGDYNTVTTTTEINHSGSAVVYPASCLPHCPACGERTPRCATVRRHRFTDKFNFRRYHCQWQGIKAQGDLDSPPCG